MAGIMETTGWPNHTTLRGIDNVIFQRYEQRPKIGRGIFNVRQSTQYQEDTLTAGGIGLMDQITEGQSLSVKSLNEGHRETFTHLDYGNMFRITRRMQREDMYGTMEKLGSELANSADATEETILANHFNNGFSGSYLGPDGVALFSTAHVRENGATYANKLSTDADLSQTSLEQALIDFSDIRDGGGKRVRVEPKSLIVPKELRFKAHELVMSTYTSEDDRNAVNGLKGLLDVIVWNYLTDTDAWFLSTDRGEHGMVLYTREEFWTDYETDFSTKDVMVSGMFAQSSGWEDPRGVFGSQCA